MNSEWKNRFFASILLTLLFPILIFFAFPSQPTNFDIIFILIGIVGGFPLGFYMTQSARKEARRSRNTRSGEYIGIFVGIVILISIGMSSIWFGKRFMLTLIASIFTCFLVVMIFLIVYYWRNRPRL